MFNALRYTEELEKAGFSRVQAEVSVKLLIDVMNENFATKADMNELRSATKADINELRQATKADISELRQATKADISELRQATKADMAELRNELKSAQAHLDTKIDTKTQSLESSIREMEYKLTIKLGGMMALSIGVTATLVKLL